MAFFFYIDKKDDYNLLAKSSFPVLECTSKDSFPRFILLLLRVLKWCHEGKPDSEIIMLNLKTSI